MHPDIADAHLLLGVSGYNGSFGGSDAEVKARNTEYGNKPDGSAYVSPKNICPARIYIGMKGKMEDGKSVKYYLIYPNLILSWFSDHDVEGKHISMFSRADPLVLDC